MITAWKWDESFLPKNGGAMYGWFFWLWMGIMAIELFCLFKFVYPKRNLKTDDKVIFTYGFIMFITEIYKQIFFTLIRGHYPYDLFPWQFCSVPMFVSLLGSLTKNLKLKEAIYKFLAFFGTSVAIATICLPEGFYWDYITISCHSFFWHTSILIEGVYLIVARGYAKDLKNMLKEVLPGALVLTIAILIALGLDVLGYNLIFKYMPDEYFNMFYISPYYGSTLPVFRDIFKVVPYPVFLFLYLLAFVLGVTLVWLITYIIKKIIRKKGEIK